MSRAVWKFPFQPGETMQVAPTPTGSTPRFFAFQYERPTIWVEVEQSAPGVEAWTFVIVGTGHELPPGPWQYVGSTIVAGGDFVFHAYARLEQG